MKIIKGSMDGVESYFVNAQRGRLIWSPNILDAHLFEEDDVTEVLVALAADTETKLTDIKAIDSNPIVGYVYRIEVQSALEKLDIYLRGRVLSKEDEDEAGTKFFEFIKDCGLPKNYLNSIGVEIDAGKVVFYIPSDDQVKRLRTLH